VDEADPITTLGGERYGTVGADTEAAVAEATNKLGIMRQSVGPLTDPEQEVVAGALDLEKTRPQGSAPITTVQSAAALSLPALSTATTMYLKAPRGGDGSVNSTACSPLARTLAFARSFCRKMR